MENTLTPCLKELHPHLWQRPPRQPEPGEGPQLWLIRTPVFREEAAARAGSVLEESETAKAAAFKRLTDRHTYQAAHVGLRLLLGAYLGVAPAGVPIGTEVMPPGGGLAPDTPPPEGPQPDSSTGLDKLGEPDSVEAEGSDSADEPN